VRSLALDVDWSDFSVSKVFDGYDTSHAVRLTVSRAGARVNLFGTLQDSIRADWPSAGIDETHRNQQRNLSGDASGENSLRNVAHGIAAQQSPGRVITQRRELTRSWMFKMVFNHPGSWDGSGFARCTRTALDLPPMFFGPRDTRTAGSMATIEVL
jgi:hypothetical protein